MSKRRRLLMSAAAALIVALGVSGCADDNVAIRVGDHTISESELMDELEVLSNPDVSGTPREQTEGDLAGSYNREFVSQVIQTRVAAILRADTLKDVGMGVTKDERAKARDELDAQIDKADLGDSIPASWREVTAADMAVDAKIQSGFTDEESAAKAEDAFEKLLKETKVELSSRWGSFDMDKFRAQQQAVTPPDGPAGAEEPQTTEPPQVIPGG